MSFTDKTTAVTTRLLWPEQLPIDRIDREMAIHAVERAYARGLLDAAVAADARTQINGARTRGELDASLGDVPEAPRPRSGLHTAVRVVAALCLVATGIQLVVWAIIGLVGGWDTPWWILSGLAGGLAVAGLWWAAEAPRRVARVAHRDLVSH
jgi:hypothetical protein